MPESPSAYRKRKIAEQTGEDYDSGLKPLSPEQRPHFKQSFRKFKEQYRAARGVGPVEEFRKTDLGAEMPERHARQKVREEFRESEYRPPRKRMKFRSK